MWFRLAFHQAFPSVLVQVVQAHPEKAKKDKRERKFTAVSRKREGRS